MIKKRSKMNNIIMWGLIATASVSLASVGFASWVINTMVPDTTDNMDITVGAVSDKSITAEAVEEAIGQKKGLSFDNLESGSNITNGDSGVEKLSFKIKTTLTIKEGSNFQDLLTSLSFTFNDALNDAVTKNYITMPFVTSTTDRKQVVTLTKVTDSNNQFTVAYTKNTTGVAIDGASTGTFSYTAGKSIDITTTFTCGWGTEFNNQNPGLLTIGDKDEITNGKITMATFKTKIEGLRTAIGTKKLNVTVTPNGK